MSSWIVDRDFAIPILTAREDVPGSRGYRPNGVSRLRGDRSTAGVGHKLTNHTWTVDGAIVSHRADLDYKFPRTGTYRVSLTVTNDAGQSSTVSLVVFVKVETVTKTLRFKFDSAVLTSKRRYRVDGDGDRVVGACVAVAAQV